MANKRILAETSKSSAASFAMGLPGGVAMGVTIPADLAQFFGMSLRLAQELSYLFGAKEKICGRTARWTTMRCGDSWFCTAA